MGSRHVACKMNTLSRAVQRRLAQKNKKPLTTLTKTDGEDKN
jgi:hypothetical protein